jgi:hypothetical protein
VHIFLNPLSILWGTNILQRGSLLGKSTYCLLTRAVDLQSLKNIYYLLLNWIKPLQLVSI